MENVLEKKVEYLRGFIGPNGIFIRVTNIDLEGSDSVEIVAESIIRNVERCNVLDDEIRLFLRTRNKMEGGIYRNYLIERYQYVFISLCCSEHKVDIKEIIGPSHEMGISEFQKKRILSLCKEEGTPVTIQKILEKQFKI